ncbi:hypothetical protein P20495_4206 [Pseudoalteromonas sp. BSi20495]|nr:hypothetical protein P20495_4206 [Pseudoalteromonas sp. BSi20495]
MFEWLLFRVKGLSLLNASYFAVFLYYEQGNTVAIGRSLSLGCVMPLLTVILHF